MVPSSHASAFTHPLLQAPLFIPSPVAVGLADEICLQKKKTSKSLRHPSLLPLLPFLPASLRQSPSAPRACLSASSAWSFLPSLSTWHCASRLANLLKNKKKLNNNKYGSCQRLFAWVGGPSSPRPCGGSCLQSQDICPFPPSGKLIRGRSVFLLPCG